MLIVDIRKIMANPNGIFQGTNELGGSGEILPAAGVTARQPLGAAQAAQRLGIWGSALSGIFGLLGNGLNYLNASAQRQFEKDENELAYRRTLENRDHLEQYNDPAAQVARFLNAGINPAAVFGNVSGGTTQDAQYNATQGQRTDFDPTAALAFAQQLTNLKQMTLQAKLLDQEYKLNNQENDRKNAMNEAQIEWITSQKAFKDWDLSRFMWLFENYDKPYYTGEASKSMFDKSIYEMLNNTSTEEKAGINLLFKFLGMFLRR